jgi:hypothetical protein
MTGRDERALRVLVACEFSGVVREAFRVRGHQAVSCDLLPAEDGGPHEQGDVRNLLDRGWDLMIAHPPCTHLAVSGARWFAGKRKEQADAPDQIVQPFHFGDPYRKTTCLWLKNLPKLAPTNDLGTGKQACWREPPHPDRWKRRSRTYPGIAHAMAQQWGAVQP